MKISTDKHVSKHELSTFLSRSKENGDKDMKSAGDKIWAFDTLDEIEINLRGIAEIALALHGYNTEHSFAVISDLAYADAERLRKTADILGKE